MVVHKLNQSTRLLVNSNDWNLNYLPTIPGQPDDKSHLA